MVTCNFLDRRLRMFAEVVHGGCFWCFNRWNFPQHSKLIQFCWVFFLTPNPHVEVSLIPLRSQYDGCVGWGDVVRWKSRRRGILCFSRQRINVSIKSTSDSFQILSSVLHPSIWSLIPRAVGSGHLRCSVSIWSTETLPTHHFSKCINGYCVKFI